jgi:hypothetical protein
MAAMITSCDEPINQAVVLATKTSGKPASWHSFASNRRDAVIRP